MSEEAKPLYFPSGEQTLFGWLHRPQGVETSAMGVLICGPFGYEAVCAHRSLRVFAETCTSVGLPTMRFDYSDTGDSSGSHNQQDQVTAWCHDIQAAIDALKRACAIRRICLVGVRLGALLAARVAASQAVDCLVAVAPVTSGRRYIRELRAFQAAAVSTGQTDPVDGLDVTGFALSQASMDTLSGIDVASLSLAATTAALILDRDDLPSAKAWANALEGAGTHVQYAAVSGFSDMVSTPHAAVVPAAVVESMGQWLCSHRGNSDPDEYAPEIQRLPNGARMRLTQDGVDLTERAMFIDADRSLFAIATEETGNSVGSDTSGYAVVLLNTGATNHIGPNRLYVELARRWAARGYVVLRLDLAGLGDSDPRPGQVANQVYPPGAIYDISVAIEFLRRRRGIRNFTLAGVCAGAYHALRSAVAGLPVNTVLLVNPLTFYWKQGSALSDLQIAEVVRNPGVYAENVRSLRHWAKLLRGEVNIWRVGMVFLKRLWLSMDSSLRDLCRRIGIRIPNDLGWDLQEVTARGVRIVFIFARGDGGQELLKVQGGSVVGRLGALCRIHVIENADHIFTQRPARTELAQLLSTELPPAPHRNRNVQEGDCLSG